MKSAEHEACEYFAQIGLSLTFYEESKGRCSCTLKTKDDHVEAYKSSLDELWRDWKPYGLRILQGANQMSKFIECYDSSNENGKLELRNAIEDYYQHPLFHSSRTQNLLSPIVDARQFCTVDDLPDDWKYLVVNILHSPYGSFGFSAQAAIKLGLIPSD
ncbi:hypothetical protein [Xanthomonas oryzae]|uniref:hypothetical protein n=1 Tax=Xanthomonas oryzae TaxID=347 RepID=UPI001034D6E2|nr:hypothetical protein [Xanthomonas oryzae]QBH00840.1 hypothetical protein EYC56_18090 [Xanthomonas oryzae]